MVSLILNEEWVQFPLPFPSSRSQLILIDRRLFFLTSNDDFHLQHHSSECPEGERTPQSYNAGKLTLFPIQIPSKFTLRTWLLDYAKCKRQQGGSKRALSLCSCGCQQRLILILFLCICVGGCLRCSLSI